MGRHVNPGWVPVHTASSPWWDYWTDGWGSQNLNTYNPAYHLRQNPGHRYSQSPWKPKRTALQQLAHPENYVIPLSTYVPPPNPYTDKRWVAMNRTREETGRNSFDINWNTLGTQ